MYQERIYRERIRSEKLYRETIVVDETDLLVVTSHPFVEKDLVEKYRRIISDYIVRRPEFTGLVPIQQDEFAPGIIQHMIEASSKAGVGPMATVAGAISHYVGQSIDYNQEIMIENGGDIYLKSYEDKVIGIYAGDSLFSNRVGVKVKSEDTPIGICTSAGKVGHSLSFGNTDAVMVISEDTLLADAMATSIGNLVKTKGDIKAGLEFGKSVLGVVGIVIIIDDELGAYGDLELVQVDEG
ncbi:MAG: UPF0280 family protein [Clostridia bacterium]|nr:UPF0280 family protein [Clostridia bacterium]